MKDEDFYCYDEDFRQDYDHTEEQEWYESDLRERVADMNATLKSGAGF